MSSLRQRQHFIFYSWQPTIPSLTRGTVFKVGDLNSRPTRGYPELIEIDPIQQQLEARPAQCSHTSTVSTTKQSVRVSGATHKEVGKVVAYTPSFLRRVTIGLHAAMSLPQAPGNAYRRVSDGDMMIHSKPLLLPSRPTVVY